MQQINDETKSKIFTIPNILSFGRICLLPVIMYVYCVKHEYLLAGYLLIVSGITDIADGFIARTFHMTSDLGKVLDPVADKLTQAALLVTLASRFPMMIIPFVMMAAKELFMLVTGSIIIRKKGVVMGASWHGKIATVLLYSTIILHLFWFEITPTASMGLIVACVAAIALSFTLYGMRNIKMLKA